MTAPANKSLIQEHVLRKSRRSNKATPVLAVLVYEEWQGTQVYYKGYRDVLAGTKTVEEILSCSGLQGVLIYLIGLFIGIRTS